MEKIKEANDGKGDTASAAATAVALEKKREEGGEENSGAPVPAAA